MTDNLRIWNNVKQPPAEMLKPIPAGRLKGFTDIDPTWRLMELTKQFGLCGFGWKYTIDNKWLEEAAFDEVIAFVDISLYIKGDDGWSEVIPGHGSSKFTVKERNGLYNNDEAYKMALSDSFSVACKALGFGADIYLGRWDGLRYTNNVVDESIVDEWLAKCEKASIDNPSTFSEWWSSNSVEVKASCDEMGSISVYQLFSTFYKRLKDEVDGK